MLQHSQFKIDSFKYSFFPRTIEEWSSLPEELTSTKNIVAFEKKLVERFYLTRKLKREACPKHLMYDFVSLLFWS